MFGILSDIMKYIFITIIYYFMFSIIKLISLDIKNGRMGAFKDDQPFIKPLCNRSKNSFKVEEMYNLEDGFIVGRGKKANIMIKDPFLSASHAEFSKDSDDEWQISDLKSTNGTYVNEEKIEKEPCAIKTGDIIKMGQLSYIFVKPKEE